MLEAALALAGLAVLTFAPGFLVRAAGIARLRRSSRGVLVLTYDDGPNAPAPTPQILELLARRGARATFFLVGECADANRELCARMAREGHDLAAHGYRHRHGWLDPLRAIGDVGAGIRAIAPYRSGRPIYRQPYGKSTLWTLLAGVHAGAAPVWWTLDSCDSREELPGLESVVERVEQEQGGIILMHDYKREAGSPGARFTLELTGRLLDLAQRRGWRVCTVSELLAGSAAQPAAGSA
ncbi:MAG: polysaccharide deacetylase family protein [Planctomycetes bacterium]|nr:polysaccharide deacetylase family protein [Planctomycetota bacterium]